MINTSRNDHTPIIYKVTEADTEITEADTIKTHRPDDRGYRCNIVSSRLLLNNHHTLTLLCKD